MVKRSGDLRRVSLNGGESVDSDAAALGRLRTREAVEDLLSAARRFLELAREHGAVDLKAHYLAMAADRLCRAKASLAALAYLVEVAS
jgi:hypothetical protein